ncbi:MAG: hypothetical protein IJR15_01245 [Clostridiales bacterium]|nr:hypothetical protein [Clostridiales bacterium]
MGLGMKLMNHVLGNLAAGAVSSLMEADNKAAEARKAEAQAKMQAYEIQKKQMDEEARRRKSAEEIAKIKAQADADKAAINVKLLDDKSFNTMKAGIVLCWYIAGIDGNISKDEAHAITERIRNIKATGDIPEKYRDAIAELETYRPMTFDEVKVYLDRADSKSLVGLALRAEYIAKMDGMTAAEKSAVDGVKLYVEQKVGYHFKDLHTMPLTVSMICPTCGGKLIPDESLRKATCDYCGFTKLVEYKS